MSRETYINNDKTVLDTDFYLYLLSCEVENQQLKSQLKQSNDVKEQAEKFVKEFQESFDCYDDVYKDMNILLSILNKRGGTDE